jgi:hypothetical protein
MLLRLLRVLIVAKARTFQTDVLLISISSTHADSKVIDLCPTKMGTDIMPSSLGLLVVGYPRHLCHSLTGQPLVPAGLTNEPQPSLQFSSEETSSPSASSARQTFLLLLDRLFTPIKRLHSVFTLLGPS